MNSPRNASPISPSAVRRHGRRTFWKSYRDQPNVVGAVLPSSRFLAKRLMKHLVARTEPARVLEVGAGTGAVTLLLGDELKAEDDLHVCEIRPELAEHLEQHILSHARFDALRRHGRLTLHCCPVQEMESHPKFDYIISGLPFTAFAPDAIREILAVLGTLLAPGGVFSYFEYVALRRIRCLATLGEQRKQMSAVSALLDERIARHQFDRDVVWRNLPPAYARHWRFDPFPTECADSGIA